LAGEQEPKVQTLSQIATSTTGETLPVQEGDHFRVTRPLPALLLTHWRAPTTGSRDVVLRPLTKLCVLSVSGHLEMLATCRPEPHRELQRQLVPWWERWRPLYGGFSLMLPIDELLQSCERLPATDKETPTSIDGLSA